MLGEPIEFRLLLSRRFLIAFDLLGLGRIDAAAIDESKLAFEPQTHGIAPCGSSRGNSRRSSRVLRKRCRRPEDGQGQREPTRAPRLRDDHENHEPQPDPTAETSAGMVSKV